MTTKTQTDLMEVGLSMIMLQIKISNLHKNYPSIGHDDMIYNHKVANFITEWFRCSSSSSILFI